MYHRKSATIIQCEMRIRNFFPLHQQPKSLFMHKFHDIVRQPKNKFTSISIRDWFSYLKSQPIINLL